MARPICFLQRWEIETNIGCLKTTMKLDVLKCRTVDGVLRELQVFALIYNMVRQVMLVAASRQCVDVRRISFVDALRWLQSASPASALIPLVVNPGRPNRLEPRVSQTPAQAIPPDEKTAPTAKERTGGVRSYGNVNAIRHGSF